MSRRKPVDVGYEPLLNREATLTKDTYLYINSVCTGTADCRTIQFLMKDYYNQALEKSKSVSWDYIVLYAVLRYETKKYKHMISANFMTLEIPYGKYTAMLDKKRRRHCRMFFIRGRKECDDYNYRYDFEDIY
ncbi:MAG: hypothetical protein NC340_05445 [Ruminococcus flavefaciens]|nr:hypothetical protein [Ruminococcus flavefaciens]MCM1229563.1 hypothetical protein [Ruminococcus flavefaciens]